MFLGRDHVMDRPNRLGDAAVGELYALGIAGRAARENDLEQVFGLGPRPGEHLGLPVGREGHSRIAFARLGRQCLDGRGGEVLEACVARVWCVAPGADRQPGRLRALSDPLDCIGRHPEVERHDDYARPDRAVVDGGQLGRRGRPGEQAIAGPQAKRAQPPGHEPGSPVELSEAPVHRAAIVPAQAKGRPLTIAGGGVVQDIEQVRPVGR